MKLLFLVVIIIVSLITVQTQKSATVAAQDLTAAAEAFITTLVAGDFAGAVTKFDDTMKSALPLEKLKETWTAVTTQAGPYKKRLKARTEERGGYRVVVLTAEFGLAPLDVTVVFDGERRIAGLFFAPAKPAYEYKPPSYSKPMAFREQEVTIGTGDWAVKGTLTLPEGPGAFPVVVLVHGSGPHDRDESIGPNKPFADLAWGLASQGVGVLRYEKRTKTHGAKFSSSFTVKEEAVDDALAAVELLRKTTRVDSKHIYVLGHSLGGMLIPRIGKLDPGIAGFIVMAGATRALEDAIQEQTSYIFLLDGTISDAEQRQLDAIKAEVAKVKSLKATDDQTTSFIFGAPASYWLDLRGYNPPNAAKELKQRLLILQGERDYQVTMEDFQRWKADLTASRSVTFFSYPKLNHLFIEGEGKSAPAEYEMPGHVAERVVNDIANWIKK